MQPRRLRAGTRIAAALALLALVGNAAGCGSRCAEVAAARDELRSRRGEEHRGADVRITLPLARINELISAILREQPVRMPLELPRLAGLQLAPDLDLTVEAHLLRVQPGPPGKLRFSALFELREGDHPLTTFSLVAEVEPVLVRAGDGIHATSELRIPLGLEQLISLTAAPGAPAALARAAMRWAPASLRAGSPLLEAAARAYGGEVMERIFRSLRSALLPRLAEVTSTRLRLPAVPIASMRLRSVTAPQKLLIIELLTSLPVRRGLPAQPEAGETRTAGEAGETGAPIAPTAPDAGEELTVQLAPSATAELANWAIETGLAPRWYSRSLSPSESGEFRPHFDYAPDDRAHPFKLYAFQERGGCSYFRVGVQAVLGLRAATSTSSTLGPSGPSPTLELTILDRALEAAVASPALELAAWVKYFLFGSLDLSRRLAAHTRLSVGARTFEARVTDAALSAEALRFALRLKLATD